jgi:hypothetical protein
MVERRVRLIHVIIEERAAGLAVATSPSLPEFYLVTKQDRLDEDIPAAIERLFNLQLGVKVEVLPVEADDELRPVHWAAIVASNRDLASA